MKKIFFLTCLLACATQLSAQLFVDTSYTANQMISTFFNGAGVTVSNVQYTGAQGSLSFFEGSQSNLSMNAGLLMTTGRAANAVGPNDAPNKTFVMGTSGTPWLDALIPGYSTQDAAIITMDVVPTTDTLCFRYVFGSEEYQEFTNSQYNDLFAFFIEGPGYGDGDSIWVEPDTAFITVWDSTALVCVDTLIVTEYLICDSTWQTPGMDSCFTVYDTITQWCYYTCDSTDCFSVDTVYYPGYWYYSPGGVNLAQVPNTNLPVAINTLNQFLNTQYFVTNDSGLTVQYDAFTTPLWAKAVVQPGQTYKVRIAIADAGDALYDSGVFIGIESLGGDSLLFVEPAFAVPPSSPGNLTVAFDNQTFWATSWEWNFGDGFTSTERYPEHTYAQPGLYTVSLTAKNWCSTETITMEVAAGVSSTGEPIAKPFTVAPNPTVNGQIRLDFASDAPAAVRITSPDGRLLFSDMVQDNAPLNLNAFGKGIFLLQVVDGNKVYTERVINR